MLTINLTESLIKKLTLLKEDLEKNGVDKTDKFYRIWMNKYPEASWGGSIPNNVQDIWTTYKVASCLRSLLIQAKNLEEEKVKV